MNWHVPMALWWIVGPLFVWRVGVRLRRLLIREHFSRRRQLLRAASLGGLVIAVGAVALEEYAAVLSLGLGLLIGALFGLLGVKRTKIEKDPDGIEFQPDPWLGAVLSVLLLGRIAYRLYAGPSDGSTGWTLAEFIRNPSTMFLFGLFSAHFITYALGVVRLVRVKAPS